MACRAVELFRKPKSILRCRKVLKEHGIYILETMNTGRLAKEGVHEFMFVLGHARLKGSVQMIINPVAMW